MEFLMLVCKIRSAQLCLVIQNSLAKQKQQDFNFSSSFLEAIDILRLLCCHMLLLLDFQMNSGVVK